MVTERVNDQLVLVGTAHVSIESVREVEAAIRDFRPTMVAVELDAGRLEALEDKQRWLNTPIHRLLKGDKLWLFLTQVLLASYQRKLGEVYGAEPGTEMLAAVRAGRDLGAQVHLVDRDVGITMKRAVRSMRFREKVRLSWELFKALFGGETPEEEPTETGKKPAAPTLQDLTKEDAVSAMMQELGQIAPSIKTVVLDERDAYLATRIQQAVATAPATTSPQGQHEPPRMVAVIGAGHLPGIRKRIQESTPPADLDALCVIPEKRFQVGKLVGWTFLALIIGFFAYATYDGIRSGNWQKLIQLITDLFLWGGGLAALGCILARGHPLSVLTAFLLAPLAILHPGLAAGWFSGIVEAWIREPRVGDFQDLSRITSVKAFFNNRVTRVLFVAAFTNLGSMAGAWIVLGKEIGGFFGNLVRLGGGLGDFSDRLFAGDRFALLQLLAIVLVVALPFLNRMRKAHAGGKGKT